MTEGIHESNTVVIRRKDGLEEVTVVRNENGAECTKNHCDSYKRHTFRVGVFRTLFRKWHIFSGNTRCC